MDKLKEMLEMDPCYEQHIVSIKEIYEDSLFSILIPAIYEGLQSIYKQAMLYEKKHIEAAKKNPEIENPGVLVLFQDFIKQIPNLNTHRIRSETDRIKSSTKSADIFDDLIKAVVKANIILLTYNVDHKRKNLLQTKYHENVIIHDFIHSCYIQCARNFFGCVELFYHRLEPIEINQNKRICFKIIRESVAESIKLMLPMKEILLEYITQKYESKETMNPYLNEGLPGILGMNTFVNPENQEEFIEANRAVDRDLMNHVGRKLLIDSDSVGDNDFGPGSEYGGEDFAALINDSGLSSNKDDTVNGDENEIENENEKNDSTNHSDKGSAESSKNSDGSKSEIPGVRMIDISGAAAKRGLAGEYFKEMMPDIKKEMEKYKTLAKTKIPPEDQIHITRSTEGHTVSDDGDEADQEDEDENKRKNKDINNVLKSSKR
jgi:hypothetical protein